MSESDPLPIVLWAVACFDRRRENPFPVYNRWYSLDWSKLTPEQGRDILGILRRREPAPLHSPSGFDETVATLSFRSTSHDTAMLQYRSLFSEIPDNDAESFLQDAERRHCGIEFVSIEPEYFEDETGTPITSYEMIQHVSGQHFPIIVGDPESILRLGPVSPADIEHWHSEKANTIAQFLDIVQRICASQWMRSPLSITTLSRTCDLSELLEAAFPTDEKTMSVLAYFRQLHAGDRLLVKAVDAYVAHCGDDRKRWWVDERRQLFTHLVDSPPMPFNTDGATRREIVRMFMYGAGLLHSSSQHGDDAALNAFVAKHGQHKTVVIFNSCLKDFLRIALDIYYVVRQDFQHWLNMGLAGPTRFQIPQLFAGYLKANAGT